MIFIDESGNTGQNLLDASQPVYVLTSHNFSEVETREILKPLTSSGAEYHFKNLKKYFKYQQQLIEVLNNEYIHENRVKYYFIDKKFALICQIVDLLIEPVLYNSNIDIYKKRHIDRDLSDKFATQIFESKITNIVSYPMLPSMKFTPTELGTTDDSGINPLDYLAELALKHDSEYQQIMSKIMK